MCSFYNVGLDAVDDPNFQIKFSDVYWQQSLQARQARARGSGLPTMLAPCAAHSARQGTRGGGGGSLQRLHQGGSLHFVAPPDACRSPGEGGAKGRELQPGGSHAGPATHVIAAHPCAPRPAKACPLARSPPFPVCRFCILGNHDYGPHQASVPASPELVARALLLPVLPARHRPSADLHSPFLPCSRPHQQLQPRTNHVRCCCVVLPAASAPMGGHHLRQAACK